MGASYYQLLGVSKNATDSQILEGFEKKTQAVSTFEVTKPIPTPRTSSSTGDVQQC